MDGGDGSLVKEIFLDPGDREAMSEVVFHLLSINPLKMATGYNSRC